MTPIAADTNATCLAYTLKLNRMRRIRQCSLRPFQAGLCAHLAVASAMAYPISLCSLDVRMLKENCSFISLSSIESGVGRPR